MSEVKRYHEFKNGVVENEHGMFVKHEDYAALQQKLDSECANLRQAIDDVLAQRDSFAAENAALKSNLMFWDAEDPEAPYGCPEDIANNCGMDLNTEFDVQVAAKMPNRTYRVCEVGEYDCKIELVSGAIPETPATDANLNSVRAEGVEMLAANHQRIADTLNGDSLFADGERRHAAIAAAAVHFAAQLRAGKDGE